MPGKTISVLGDPGSHGGVLTTTNTDNKMTVKNLPVCADGCTLNCAIHGPQPVTAITIKSFVNSKRIITTGAIAACSAIIASPDRGVYIE